MDNEEIIVKLQSVLTEYKTRLTPEQITSINDACVLLKNAHSKEVWRKAAELLGPLIIQIVSKFLDP